MAEIPYTDVVNDNPVALTDTQLDTARRYEKGLGYVPLSDALKNPAAVFPIELRIAAALDATNKSSIPWKVPFPCRLVCIDMGIESTASAGACVGDILVDPLAVGSPVSILDAAEDVKTTAPDFKRVAPETTKGTLARTDKVTFKVTSTGAGAVVGCVALLWVQRL